MFIQLQGKQYQVIESDAYYYILKRLDTYYIVLHSSELLSGELGQSVQSIAKGYGKVNYSLVYSYDVVDLLTRQ